MGRPSEDIRNQPQRVEAPRQRPIDLTHLAQQALGDWGLECEILRLFEQISRTYFGRLAASTGIADQKLNLHSLKGAASGVGAWGIAELAKDAEGELRTHGTLDAERIEDLRIAVEEVSAFIADILRHEPA